MMKFFKPKRKANKKNLEKLNSNELTTMKRALDCITSMQKRTLPAIPLRSSSLLPEVPERSSSLINS